MTADEKGFKPAQRHVQEGDSRIARVLANDRRYVRHRGRVPTAQRVEGAAGGPPVTIEISTDKDRRLTFQCGMGMYKSAVVVN